jgi:sugar (pentulose or hexulose) kinase
MCAPRSAPGPRAEATSFNSCGTAEAYVRAVDAPLSEEAAVAAVAGGVAAGCHVVPGKDALMGGFTSGLILDRWLDALGIPPGDRAALDDAALAVEGADGFAIDAQVLQRADPSALPRDRPHEHVWRSVLESLAGRGRSVLTTIERVSGPIPGLAVTGGVARGRAFREIKHRLVAPFVIPSVQEAGARGAALLGGCAAGLYPDATGIPAPGSAT